MDREQLFLDRLFEEPETLKGILNKTIWLHKALCDAPYRSKNYNLILRISDETRLKLRIKRNELLFNIHHNNRNSHFNLLGFFNRNND